MIRTGEIDIHLGARVCRVDVDNRTIETDRGHFRAWWAREDSNLQPSGYEPLALTIELRAR
jgi:hypothetical protein